LNDGGLLRQFLISIIMIFGGAYNVYSYYKQPYSTHTFILNIIILIGGISELIAGLIRVKKLKNKSNNNTSGNTSVSMLLLLQ